MLVIKGPGIESRSLGTKWKPKNVEFWAFVDPSGQNQLYHTPLLSKIWDLNDICVRTSIFISQKLGCLVVGSAARLGDLRVWRWSLSRKASPFQSDFWGNAYYAEDHSGYLEEKIICFHYREAVRPGPDIIPQKVLGSQWRYRYVEQGGLWMLVRCYSACLLVMVFWVSLLFFVLFVRLFGENNDTSESSETSYISDTTETNDTGETSKTSDTPQTSHAIKTSNFWS